MHNQRDIHATAKLLLCNTGEAAILVANDMALRMHNGGDADGEEIWCQVLEAIEELSRTPRLPDQRKH